MDTGNLPIRTGLELFKIYIIKYSRDRGITPREAYEHRLIKEVKEYYLDEPEEIEFDSNGGIV